VLVKLAVSSTSLVLAALKCELPPFPVISPGSFTGVLTIPPPVLLIRDTEPKLRSLVVRVSEFQDRSTLFSVEAVSGATAGEPLHLVFIDLILSITELFSQLLARNVFFSSGATVSPTGVEQSLFMALILSCTEDIFRVLEGAGRTTAGQLELSNTRS